MMTSALHPSEANTLVSSPAAQRAGKGIQDIRELVDSLPLRCAPAGNDTAGLREHTQ